MHTQVNSHGCFRKRHRLLERGGFWWPLASREEGIMMAIFPPQNLNGETMGVMKKESREFRSSGRHAGQVMKPSVSRKSG